MLWFQLGISEMSVFANRKHSLHPQTCLKVMLAHTLLFNKCSFKNISKQHHCGKLGDLNCTFSDGEHSNFTSAESQFIKIRQFNWESFATASWLSFSLKVMPGVFIILQNNFFHLDSCKPPTKLQIQKSWTVLMHHSKCIFYNCSSVPMLV